MVKEAIGSGEGGLRVEVSLKYRRLLVQKLAKSSLITTQEHESFRSTSFCNPVCWIGLHLVYLNAGTTRNEYGLVAMNWAGQL